MPLVQRPFRMVEIFCGDGKLGKSMYYSQISTAQLNVRMGRHRGKRVTSRAFDLLTAEGLASFGGKCYCCIPKNHRFTAFFRQKSKPRLAVWTVMNAEFGNFMCWIALVCSSFSAMNVFTSGRTDLTPWGDLSKSYVRVPWRQLVSFAGPLQSFLKMLTALQSFVQLFCDSATFRLETNLHRAQFFWRFFAGHCMAAGQ